MQEIREYNVARATTWYPRCKNILLTLYHFSEEFTGDGKVPGNTFSSPTDFAAKLDGYRAFVERMAQELDEEAEAYKQAQKVDGPPFLVGAIRERVAYILDSIDYVTNMRSEVTSPAGPLSDLTLVETLAARFHESVLALKKHPHGGATLTVSDEWDCQYLFRSILAGYFRDVRREEWNPSFAGLSSRCEFFLKGLRTMVELKYVRKPLDQKKIKSELLTDFGDYGANAEVDFVVVLIYDPQHKLEAAVALQEDLSGPSNGLTDRRVIVSPPR